MTNYDNAVLCYIEGHYAYFTTQSLDKQWGDDWNDAPYEHNAETPYTPYEPRDGKDAWQIYEVLFVAPALVTPASGCYNSSYSVEQINKRVIPWLRPGDYDDHGITIFAGTTLPVFIEQVKATGGLAAVLEDGRPLSTPHNSPPPRRRSHARVAATRTRRRPLETTRTRKDRRNAEGT